MISSGQSNADQNVGLGVNGGSDAIGANVHYVGG
jgi:hypothetical protein